MAHDANRSAAARWACCRSRRRARERGAARPRRDPRVPAGRRPPPALGLQLQDGFVLGLVRAGVQVLDPTDTAKKLEGHPELQRCDTSPCLKAIGQLLDVGYIVRVKVEVAGNSYKTVARLFSTEGAAPAALPITTESKTCDVCTVAEARAIMLRLADALRAHIEDTRRRRPSPATPRSRPRACSGRWSSRCWARWRSARASPCWRRTATAPPRCDENRTRNAAGGGSLAPGGVTSAAPTSRSCAAAAVTR